MTAARPPAVVFDHVALAVPTPSDPLRIYVDRCGARPLGGKPAAGYRWEQVEVPASNGRFKIEALWPTNDDPSAFLPRFLDRHGAGAHHLTFAVSQLEQQIASCELAGFGPVSANLDNSSWREAFLSPRKSCGIVVQLVELAEHSVPSDRPRSPTGAATVFDRVELFVADLEWADALFHGVLRGQASSPGPSERSFTWPGGGTLRAIERDHAWLDGRAGRFGRLVFTTWPGPPPSAVAADDNNGIPISFIERGS